MLCYKDLTFCKSDCTNSKCFRQYNEKVVEGARAWWSHDSDNAPIATSDLSKVCDYYETRNGSKIKGWNKEVHL